MKAGRQEAPPWRWLGSLSPTPDFLRPRRTVHPVAWLLLALAVATAWLSAHDGLQAWQQLHAAEQQLAEARLQLDRARPIAKAALGRRPSVRDDPARHLGYPWLAVFEAVETASVPDVRWLGLEHAIDGPLRLEGEAAHTDAAWQATEALRSLPGWRDVGLNRLEQADTAGATQRFDLTAKRPGAASGADR